MAVARFIPAVCGVLMASCPPPHCTRSLVRRPVRPGPDGVLRELPLVRQPDDAQRGKRDRGRVLEVVPSDRLCGEIADGDPAAAELGAVGIEDLDPPTRPSDPDPMVVADQLLRSV